MRAPASLAAVLLAIPVVRAVAAPRGEVPIASSSETQPGDSPNAPPGSAANRPLTPDQAGVGAPRAVRSRGTPRCGLDAYLEPMVLAALNERLVSFRYTAAVGYIHCEATHRPGLQLRAGFVLEQTTTTRVEGAGLVLEASYPLGRARLGLSVVPIGDRDYLAVGARLRLPYITVALDVLRYNNYASVQVREPTPVIGVAAGPALPWYVRVVAGVLVLAGGIGHLTLTT